MFTFSTGLAREAWCYADEPGAQPSPEGDGSQPSDDVSRDSSGGSQADTRLDGSDDDDPLISDEDFADTPFHQHPRFKAVLGKLRKLSRREQKLKAQAARYQGVDVDALSQKARIADQFQDLLRSRPDLAEQMTRAVAGGPPQPASEPEFDPSKLPFNVEDDVGKFFVGFYKEFLEAKKANQKLQQQLAGLVGERQNENTTRVLTSWKSAVDAAGAELPEGVREMFNDAVYGAYQEAQRRGARIGPQQVVNHYLTKLRKAGLVKAGAAQKAAAASQRIAEHNRNLPTVPRGGGPASARNPKETVADVNRRLRSMFAR